ncbi:MAG: hypothetical protein JWO82_3048 [Akkermansiaceae bacterium]|nr:hypothetical protein [Akkermansiaceae bacterium]
MKSILRICAFAVLALSSARAEDGKWESIFNGKDLDGWTPKIRGLAYGEDPNKTFSVSDGVMKVSYANYKEWGEAYGHIFWKTKLSHYRIRLEYRFTGQQIKGGAGWALENSGIMLHSQDPKTMGKDQSFPASLEFQLLGADNSMRMTGSVCSPGTYLSIKGKEDKTHCIMSTTPAAPLDEWVVAEAEVHGGKLIKHFINGKEGIEYTDTKLDENDGDAKPLIELQGGKNDLTEGYICLQSESHPCEFRKIEVMILDEK